MGLEGNRVLEERAIGVPGAASGSKRPARSVTINTVESPLGWLRSRGHISDRQFDAGEQLRLDWERAAFAERHHALGRSAAFPRPWRRKAWAGTGREPDEGS